MIIIYYKLACAQPNIEEVASAEIFSYTLVNSEEMGMQFAVYSITVILVDGRRFSVKKRYSQFRQLRFDIITIIIIIIIIVTITILYYYYYYY